MEESRYLRSQLLLAELNPHFIFNVLSAIQNKILFEQKELAAEYIVKLSKLMRNFLSVSHKANLLIAGKPEYEIHLSQEIELLEGFLEFERIKNNEHFGYEVIVKPGLQPEYKMIPPGIPCQL